MYELKMPTQLVWDDEILEYVEIPDRDHANVEVASHLSSLTFEQLGIVNDLMLNMIEENRQGSSAVTGERSVNP